MYEPIVSLANADQAITDEAAVHCDDRLVEHVNAVNYFEPEELARIILEETPETLDAFKDQAEMVEYICEALAATRCGADVLLLNMIEENAV